MTSSKNFSIDPWNDFYGNDSKRFNKKKNAYKIVSMN